MSTEIDMSTIFYMTTVEKDISRISDMSTENDPLTENVTSAIMDMSTENDMSTKEIC